MGLRLLGAAPARGTGIHVPSDWGRFWKPKRNAAATAKATVAIIGESVSYGSFSSQLNTKSWPGLLRVALHTAYTGGGTGYMSTARSSPFWDTMTNLNAVHRTAWGSQAFALTGTWTPTTGYGPGAVFLGSTVSGSTLGLTVNGTSVHIYAFTGLTNGSYTYSIDGGSAVTVSTAVASTVQKTSITGLAAGFHGLNITTTSNSQTAIAGVAAENATGVVFNNFSLPGAIASSYTTAHASALAASWSGGVSYPADLAIIELGANDANQSVTVTTWSKNMRLILDEIRDETSGAVDLMFVMPHIYTFDQGGLALYQDYCAQARTLASVYGAAVVDVWSLLRNSRVYAQSLNFFGGNASTAGGVGTDIHPSDVGHQIMADAIIPIVAA